MPDLRDLKPEERERFASEVGGSLLKDAAILILERYCTPSIGQRIAVHPRLTVFYTIRTALARHRSPPQAEALNVVPHLYWRDAQDVREATIPAVVRHAIDQQMPVRLPKVTLREKITAARICCRNWRTSMLKPSPRVFKAVLVNPRPVESDRLNCIGSGSRPGRSCRSSPQTRSRAARGRFSLTMRPARTCIRWIALTCVTLAVTWGSVYANRGWAGRVVRVAP